MTRKQQDQQTTDEIRKLQNRHDFLERVLHNPNTDPHNIPFFKDEIMMIDVEINHLKRTLSEEPEDPNHFGIPIA